MKEQSVWRSRAVLKSMTQKMSVIKSNKKSTKDTKKVSKPFDMFTPVVNSFNPVSKSIVSRYVQPKLLQKRKMSTAKPKQHSPKSLPELMKRKSSNYSSFNRFFNGDNKNWPRPKFPRETRYSKTMTMVKTASSAASRFSDYTMSKRRNRKTWPRSMNPFHTIKNSESPGVSYNKPSKNVLLSSSPHPPKYVTKFYRKPVQRKICVEGISDTISVKCRSKLYENNPQLFGSLSSSVGLNTHRLKRENDMKSNFIKTLKSNNARMNNFISKIPKSSLSCSKQKQKFVNDHLMTPNRRIRNSFCENNIILEENTEEEKESTSTSRNLAIKKNEDVKHKFHENFSEKTIRESEKTKPMNQNEEVDGYSKPINKSVIEQDMEHSYKTHSREYQKRSFFTVSIEESQNSSSLYETCKTNSSHDIFLVYERELAVPPPPTPSKERVSVEIINDKHSSSNNIDDSLSPQGEKQECMTDNHHSTLSSTFARISGKPSSNSETLQESFIGSELNEAGKDLDINKSEIGEGPKDIVGSTTNLTGLSIFNCHHVVEHIPSISDTYVEQLPSFLECSVEERKCDLNSCGNKCKSVPAFSDSMKNDDSINSNTVLANEVTISYANSRRDISSSSQLALDEASIIASDISSLSASPRELIEESKMTLEKFMKCIQDREDDSDYSFKDILNDLCELSYYIETLLNRKAECYSSESLRKRKKSPLKLEKIPNHEKTGYLFKPPNMGSKSRINNIQELKRKLPSSKLVHLKRHSKSQRDSQEIFPESSEGTPSENNARS